MLYLESYNETTSARRSTGDRHKAPVQKAREMVWYPDLCSPIVTRYQDRFNYEQIQRRLQEALENDGEVASVEEIARQMGCKRQLLWTNFPDLCNQLSACRFVTRKKQHNERIVVICEEIHSVAIQLYSQGIYPSARQISKQLSDPHAIRTKEGHETWRQVLNKLGYSTEHLTQYT